MIFDFLVMYTYVHCTRFVHLCDEQIGEWMAKAKIRFFFLFGKPKKNLLISSCFYALLTIIADESQFHNNKILLTANSLRRLGNLELVRRFSNRLNEKLLENEICAHNSNDFNGKCVKWAVRCDMLFAFVCPIENVNDADA